MTIDDQRPRIVGGGTKKLLYAADTILRIRALAHQKFTEHNTLRIDEIPEHVHVSSLVYRSDFDTGDEAHADVTREGSNLRHRRHGVVVRHAHRPDTGAPRHVDELGRLAHTIRCRGVQVKVNDAGHELLSSDPFA